MRPPLDPDPTYETRPSFSRGNLRPHLTLAHQHLEIARQLVAHFGTRAIVSFGGNGTIEVRDRHTRKTLFRTAPALGRLAAATRQTDVENAIREDRRTAAWRRLSSSIVRQVYPCRAGTVRMDQLLAQISAGNATRRDLDRLETQCDVVKHTSLSGLGQAAPNPVPPGTAVMS
jgi:hypothetical protein